MEFEELKKIWDTQNNKPMFIINEEALHRTIQKKKNVASWISDINEISLMLIAIVTSAFLIIKNLDNDNIYAFPPAIFLLLTGLYVLVGRIKRKKNENRFDRSVIGDLDHAIANTEFEIKRAKTFVWWYILPVMIPSFLNMMMNDAPLLTWVLVFAALVLSFFVVRWGLIKSQMPRYRNLLSLRKKLLEDVENTDDLMATNAE
ncbi:MAG: hypothetical protein AAFQ94_24275 [Bacteroidota bacterium]